MWVGVEFVMLLSDLLAFIPRLIHQLKVKMEYEIEITFCIGIYFALIYARIVPDL